jgi:large subunit ribosomal protein L25
MMVVSIAAPISEAKLEALLATTPAGEGAAEPEVIGKGKEEEGVTEEGAEAAAKPGAAAAPAAAGAKPGTAAPAAEAKGEGKKEGKEAKGEKKK